jgi:hypothetical protein
MIDVVKQILEAVTIGEVLPTDPTRSLMAAFRALSLKAGNSANDLSGDYCSRFTRHF